MAIYIPYDRGGRAAQAQALMSAVQLGQGIRNTRIERREEALGAEVAGTESGHRSVWIANQNERDPQALQRTLRRLGYNRREVDDMIARSIDQVARDDLDPTTVQRVAQAEMLRRQGQQEEVAASPSPLDYQAVDRLTALAERGAVQAPPAQGVSVSPGQMPAPAAPPAPLAIPAQTQPAPQVQQAQPQPTMPPGPHPAMGEADARAYYSPSAPTPPAGTGEAAARLRYSPQAPQRTPPRAQVDAVSGAAPQAAAPAPTASPAPVQPGDELALPPPTQGILTQARGRMFERDESGRQPVLSSVITSPEFTSYLGHPYVNRAAVRQAAEEGALTQELVDQFARSQAALLAVDSGEARQITPEAVVGFLAGAGVEAQVSPDGRGVVVGGEEAPATVQPPAAAPTPHIPPATNERATSLLQRAASSGNASFAFRAGQEYRQAAQAELRTPEGRTTQAEGLLRMLSDPDGREVFAYGALTDDQAFMLLGQQLMTREAMIAQALSGGMSQVEIEYMRAQTQNELAQAAERMNNIDMSQVEVYGDLLATLSNMRANVATAQTEAFGQIVDADLQRETRERAVAGLFNLSGALEGMNSDTEAQFMDVLGMYAPYRAQDVVQYRDAWLRGNRFQFVDDDAGGLDDAAVRRMLAQ